VTLPTAVDSYHYTVMSYTQAPSFYGANPDTSRMGALSPWTPMIYDIQAIQHLYGANTSTAASNDTYVFDPSRTQFMTIWDAGGIDIIDASRQGNSVTIDLAPGALSTISMPYGAGISKTGPDGQVYTQPVSIVGIALGTIIENAASGSAGDVIWGNAVSNTLSGNTGDDRLHGLSGNDYLSGGDGFDIALFGDSPDAVTVDLSAGFAASARIGRDTLVSIEGAGGGSGSDLFIGTGSENQFFGGDGSDTVIYNGGSDWFDGGAGRDTVTRFGLRHEYSTFAFGGGNGAVGGQSTAGVEKFVFADGTLTTDTADSAVQVFKLYGATLGRTPDLGGLRAWTGAIESKAMTLDQTVDGLNGSAEFQAKYGSLNNTAFVKMLYVDVLGREADARGQAAWIGGLNGGMTRPQVVLGFSESTENIARRAPDVQKGLWIGDDLAMKVARMYDTTLDRMGDAPGIRGWIGALKSGTTLKAMADGYTGSAEFRGKYGALDDTSFVRQLYRNVLDRDGEESGVKAWVGGLKGGLTRSDIVIGFSESNEHVVKLAGLTDHGVNLYA
jgi:serralysin